MYPVIYTPSPILEILVGFWLDSGISGGFQVNSGWVFELYLQVQVHFLSKLHTPPPSLHRVLTQS